MRSKQQEHIVLNPSEKTPVENKQQEHCKVSRFGANRLGRIVFGASCPDSFL